MGETVSKSTISHRSGAKCRAQNCDGRKIAQHIVDAANGTEPPVSFDRRVLCRPLATSLRRQPRPIAVWHAPSAPPNRSPSSEGLGTEYAASVAALLITTEAMVAEVPKKNQGGAGMPPGGGGMGGMGGMDY